MFMYEFNGHTRTQTRTTHTHLRLRVEFVGQRVFVDFDILDTIDGGVFRVSTRRIDDARLAYVAFKSNHALCTDDITRLGWDRSMIKVVIKDQTTIDSTLQFEWHCYLVVVDRICSVYVVDLLVVILFTFLLRLTTCTHLFALLWSIQNLVDNEGAGCRRRTSKLVFILQRLSHTVRACSKSPQRRERVNHDFHSQISHTRTTHVILTSALAGIIISRRRRPNDNRRRASVARKSSIHHLDACACVCVYVSRPSRVRAPIKCTSYYSQSKQQQQQTCTTRTIFETALQARAHTREKWKNFLRARANESALAR